MKTYLLAFLFQLSYLLWFWWSHLLPFSRQTLLWFLFLSFAIWTGLVSFSPPYSVYNSASAKSDKFFTSVYNFRQQWLTATNSSVYLRYLYFSIPRLPICRPFLERCLHLDERTSTHCFQREDAVGPNDSNCSINENLSPEDCY